MLAGGQEGPEPDEVAGGLCPVRPNGRVGGQGDGAVPVPSPEPVPLLREVHGAVALSWRWGRNVLNPMVQAWSDWLFLEKRWRFAKCSSQSL